MSIWWECLSWSLTWVFIVISSSSRWWHLQMGYMSSMWCHNVILTFFCHWSPLPLIQVFVMMIVPFQWAIVGSIFCVMIGLHFIWKSIKHTAVSCSLLPANLALKKRYNRLHLQPSFQCWVFGKNKQHSFRCFLLQLLNPFHHQPLFASWLAVSQPHVLLCSTLISDKRGWGMSDYSTAH